MSREYNYGGSSLIVDNIEELFENGAVSTKAISNIKQVVGQQRQTKDLTDLKEQLENATSDGVITVSEKPGLKREWASLVSSFASISDRFETDGNIANVTVYTTLKSIMEDLTPIMEDVFADMNSDYTNSAIISDITLRFVTAWEYLTFCSQLLEGKLSLSDRHILQISENRSIVSTLEVKASLLIIEEGLYVDYTGMSSVYPDSDFVWRKTSDEEFVRTGRTLTLALSDMSSETETFSLTFTHTYADAQEEGNDVIIAKSISFSISTGTLLEWAWSDAPTKAELLIDPLAIWQGERTENESKKYLWRRETTDVLLPDADRTWTYFRESGLDGIDGYSRAQLTLYKRSASGEPSKSDLGTITYTFATNAYSGTLGGWSTSIPSGEGELYAIYASAFFNGVTDTIQPNEWTTPAKLSTDGAKGEDGMSIYTVLLFKRSASIPSTPSGTVTYNFHTNTLTGADGWYREPPASDGNPIYAITATAASNTGTDVISPSEWSTPMIFVKDGNDGEPGKGIDSIDYSYALSTTEDQPADSQFTEGVKTMTSINKYLWQKEVITYTTGDYKTTYALIGVYGDTGNGISGIAYYYALSTSSTQPSSITNTTLPIMTSTNKYLWQKEVISYTNGESKTTVALIGVYGDKGENGDDGKDGFSTIIEWCLSPSNIELTESNTSPQFLMHSDKFALWGNYPLSYSSPWLRYKPNPTTDKPYIWERVSNDSGATWTNPYCITNSPFVRIFLTPSHAFYKMLSTKWVAEAQTITVHCTKMFTTASCQWSVKLGAKILTYSGVDVISFTIPVGATYESVEIKCYCDGKYKLLTIEAEIETIETYKKLSTININNLASTTTRDDGSPLVVGDYRLVLSGEYHLPYVWNGTNWKGASPTDSNYGHVVSSLAPDVWASDQTIPSISAIYGFYKSLFSSSLLANTLAVGSNEFLELLSQNNDLMEGIGANSTVGDLLAKNESLTGSSDFKNAIGLDTTIGELLGKNATLIETLIAQTAFISSLFSQTINLLGTMYGGAFDADGNNSTGGTGFHIEAQTGQLKATGVDIQGTINAGGGSFTGEIHATGGSFVGSIVAQSGEFSGTINANSFKTEPAGGTSTATISTGSSAQSQITSLISGFTTNSLSTNTLYKCTVTGISNASYVLADISGYQVLFYDENRQNIGEIYREYKGATISGSVYEYYSDWAGTSLTVNISYGGGERFIFKDLQTNSAGLVTGQVYTDSSGNLKVVL